MSKIEFLENAYKFDIINKKKYILELKTLKNEIPRDYWYGTDDESINKINSILADIQ